MKIYECIDVVDKAKPNQYPREEKIRWLSYIEGKIMEDIIKMHTTNVGEEINFSGYNNDSLEVELIAPAPYDELYVAYLKMKIDEENGETGRYNNAAILFNAHLTDFAKYWNKTHKPVSTRMKLY